MRQISSAFVILMVFMLFPDRAFPKSYIATPGHPPAGDLNLTAYLGLSPFGNLGVGGKGSLRILENGFIPPINNSVAIEAGIFRGRYREYYIFDDAYYSRTYVTVGMRWDFHLAKAWTVYGLLESGVYLSSNHDIDDNSDLLLNPAVGAFYHFSPNLALRMEYSELTQTSNIGVTFKI